MRLLMFSTARTPGPNLRLMGSIGLGMMDRGATVAYATGNVDAVRQQLVSESSAANVFAIDDRNWFRTYRTMRDVARRFMPDIVFTDRERDTLIASVATKRWTGVIRRVRAVEDANISWRTRIAARLGKVSLLVPTSGDAIVLPRNVRAVRAPVSLPFRTRSPLLIRSEVEPAPPVIACLPDSTGAAAALCLRAFARLRQRRPELTLLLFGDPQRLQAVRIHAAALGLTEFIRTLPEAALFERAEVRAAMIWIAARGDRGCLAAVASMARGLPIVVDRNSDVAAFVAHRITGLHADETDLSATVASMSQLLADPAAFHSTCEAAIARAQRVHSWNGFLDRVVEAIELTRSEPRARSRSASVTA